MTDASDVIVFLGPTMRHDDARGILDASYRAPAIGGDIYACLREEQPAAIAIIDGCFDTAPSVRHKEVLYALSQGVHVFGAASMGALRAAELHAFGMTGVGTIFEWFRSGRLEDDDEVAVLHAADDYGFRELSDAMVNIRAALGEAVIDGRVSRESEALLASLAKRRFYPDRRWPDLIAEARGQVPDGELDALAQWLREARPNQKRADARALLRVLRDFCATERSPHQPSFELAATPVWYETILSVDRRFE
jgi:hypothetical protein